MLEKIRSIILEFIEVDAEEIQPEADLRGLGLNSYDFMNVVARFEQEFSIVIPDRDIHLLETVSDVIEYLEAAIAKR
jgi:acyl carrier protein